MTPWRLSHRFDPEAVAIADRHYSRQQPGTPQFVAPGSCVVLLASGPALWVSLRQRFVQHAWPLAWCCTLFRNEGQSLSSALITMAVAATIAAWGAPPVDGFVTFVDAAAVRPKRDPGRCFRRAGWLPAGHTASGLLALRLARERFPEASPAVAGPLFAGEAA